MHAPLPTPPGPNEDRDAYYQALLDNLIGRAAELAARIHEGAIADSTPENPPATSRTTPQQAAAAAEATIPYDRILRAIRRSIALARHIATHPTATQPGAAQPGAAQPNTPKPPAPPQTPRKRPPASPARAELARNIQNVARAGYNSEDDLVTRVLAFVPDRELDHGIDGRPIEDVIDEICRELGLEMPRRTYVWRRRTPQDLPRPQPGARRHTPRDPRPTPRETRRTQA